ncbi:hypothetical protein WDW86_00365 [Bdellovibrionota bacterium FG-2]
MSKTNNYRVSFLGRHKTIRLAILPVWFLLGACLNEQQGNFAHSTALKAGTEGTTTPGETSTKDSKSNTSAAAVVLDSAQRQCAFLPAQTVNYQLCTTCYTAALAAYCPGKLEVKDCVDPAIADQMSDLVNQCIDQKTVTASGCTNECAAPQIHQLGTCDCSVQKTFDDKKDYVLDECNGTNILASGKTLDSKNPIYSCNKAYVLVMQEDGNLVLYNSAQSALWAINLEIGALYNNKGSSASMQDDGNFVVYNNKPTLEFKALWASATNSAENAGAYLTVQDSGVIVIKNTSSKDVWLRPEVKKITEIDVPPDQAITKPGDLVSLISMFNTMTPFLYTMTATRTAKEDAATPAKQRAP